MIETKIGGKGLELSKAHQSHLYATKKVLLTSSVRLWRTPSP
jgi:hypothetical protein